MPDDVRADYERLSAGGQTPAVLLGPGSSGHSADELAKVQQARQGIGLPELSPFEAFSFLNGTPGGGQDSHHAWQDSGFAFDAPGGQAGDQGEPLYRGSDRNGPGSPGFAFDAPASGIPASTTLVHTGSSGGPAALVDSGLRAPSASLVDVFRQIQNPDDPRTNTALAINAWCLLDGGGGGTAIVTRTYAAFMRFAFPSKLIRVGLYAHPVGSLTVDILRGTLGSFGTWATIVGAVTPSFSATDHVELTADQLTDWDVLNSRADLLRIDITVAATCEIALLDLWAIRTDASDKTTN